jgi:hypothetical protein
MEKQMRNEHLLNSTTADLTAMEIPAFLKRDPSEIQPIVDIFVAPVKIAMPVYTPENPRPTSNNYTASKPTAEGTQKKGKGDNNPLRQKALELFKTHEEAGMEASAIIKSVQAELKISYANTHYYFNRVYKK